jgi:hypothetical protein
MEEIVRLLLVLFVLAMVAVVVWSADGERSPFLSEAGDCGTDARRPPTGQLQPQTV